MNPRINPLEMSKVKTLKACWQHFPVTLIYVVVGLLAILAPLVSGLGSSQINRILGGTINELGQHQFYRLITATWLYTGHWGWWKLLVCGLLVLIGEDYLGHRTIAWLVPVTGILSSLGLAGLRFALQDALRPRRHPLNDPYFDYASLRALQVGATPVICALCLFLLLMWSFQNLPPQRLGKLSGLIKGLIGGLLLVNLLPALLAAPLFHHPYQLSTITQIIGFSVGLLLYLGTSLVWHWQRSRHQRFGKIL